MTVLLYNHYVDGRLVKLTMPLTDYSSVRVEFPETDGKAGSHLEAYQLVQQTFRYMPRRNGLALTITPLKHEVPFFLLDGPAVEKLCRFDSVQFLLDEIATIAVGLEQGVKTYQYLREAPVYLVEQIFNALGENNGTLDG